MGNNYHKAYVEVLEILKYIPKEEFDKIPKDMIQTFTEKADNNYQYHIDKTIPFEKQVLLDETKSILAILFRDYWATDFQREQILLKEKLDTAKAEEELSEKYKYDDLFKRKQNMERQTKEMIVYEKEKWYEKFLHFIRKLFKR